MTALLALALVFTPAHPVNLAPPPEAVAPPPGVACVHADDGLDHCVDPTGYPFVTRGYLAPWLGGWIPAADVPKAAAYLASVARSLAPRAQDVTSLDPCGGAYPPCAVKRRESGGFYGAVNARGCSGRGCYGAWQFDPLTWNAQALDAGRPDLIGHYLPTPADQDLVAAHTWALGRGCANWSAC